MLLTMPLMLVAAADASATLPRPADILAATRRVADWQIAHRDGLDRVATDRPSLRNPRDWQQATFWVAMTALADRDQRYRSVLLDLGRAQQWRLGDRPFHADDQLIGQTWLWAARHGAGAKALAPMRAYYDNLIANRPAGGLAFIPKPEGGDPPCTTHWCWCDALFMAPATMIQLSRATGDPRYARLAHADYAATKAYLFDPQEHLFFRDSRFIDRRDDQGRKLFWSRGNGWVMAGLVRIIESLDRRDPERARYVALFREMAARVVTLQRPNGYWAPSLLEGDGLGVPPETSGTGFFVYSLARGADLGLLDRDTYLPAAVRGWAALGRAIQPDGMIGWVQQVSDRPDAVAREDTQFYGAGAFVLAGTALYDLAQRRPVR
jgi:rhamnogalacturonyl hydrolase YesR